MPSATRFTVPIRPPLRLDIQRGTVQLTSGQDAFRKILFLNSSYWLSRTAGEGLFRRETDGSELPLLRTDLEHILLYPEGNPFDEELQRVHALRQLWRVIPDLPSPADYRKALKPRPETDLRPKIEPTWDEIYERMVEEAAGARKGRGLYRFLPAFFRRLRAKSRMASQWPEYRSAREAEFQEISGALDAVRVSSSNWDDRERSRISRLQRLLEADPAETEAATRELLPSLLFPFDTDLEVWMEDSRNVHLSFLAPQLDRIIQPSTRDLMTSGEVRKVKRDREEIHRDFSVLVTGQAIQIATMLFASLPALETASVSCSTLPPNPTVKRGRARIQAEAVEAFHIFEVEFHRSDFEDALIEPFEPLVFLNEHKARVHPLSSVALGRIDPPAWLSRS